MATYSDTSGPALTGDQLISGLGERRSLAGERRIQQRRSLANDRRSRGRAHLVPRRLTGERRQIENRRAAA